MQAREDDFYDNLNPSDVVKYVTVSVVTIGFFSQDGFGLSCWTLFFYLVNKIQLDRLLQLAIDYNEANRAWWRDYDCEEQVRPTPRVLRLQELNAARLENTERSLVRQDTIGHFVQQFGSCYRILGLEPNADISAIEEKYTQRFNALCVLPLDARTMLLELVMLVQAKKILDPLTRPIHDMHAGHVVSERHSRIRFSENTLEYRFKKEKKEPEGSLTLSVLFTSLLLLLKSILWKEKKESETTNELPKPEGSQTSFVLFRPAPVVKSALRKPPDPSL